MFGRGWEDGLTAKARRRLGWGWVGIFQRRDAETRRSQRGAELGWMGGWVFTRRREGTKLGMGAGVVEFLVLKIALP